MKEMNFELDGFGQLSAFVNDAGDPWFLAKDVAKSLDYIRKDGRINVSDMVKYLDDDEKAETLIQRLSSNGVKQARKVKLISESGLYHAIFMSRKPEANVFRKWVTSTVLPSIRKNGGYIAGQEFLSDEERSYLESQIRDLSEKVRYQKYRIDDLIEERDLLRRDVKNAESETNYWSEIVDQMDRNGCI